MSDTLLLIDDDEKLLIGLKEFFKQSGFIVRTASDGKQGLEQIRNCAPDMVLCDVTMPDPNGFELKKILNETPDLQKIPFIFLTARDAKEDILNGITNSGANDYIVKPFDLDILLARVTNILRQSKPIFVNEIKEINQRHLMHTLKGLNKMQELRDFETSDHCERVALATVLFASRLNVSETDFDHFYLGAYFHDIGIIGIPDRILRKKTPLTKNERLIFQEHPLYSYDLLSKFDLAKPALNIPLYHHERWDGSGYPYGLGSEEIPLWARVFSIADTWDAMTHDRVYRKALSEAEVTLYLRREAGKSFQADFVAVFLEMIKTGSVYDG